MIGNTTCVGSSRVDWEVIWNLDKARFELWARLAGNEPRRLATLTDGVFRTTRGARLDILQLRALVTEHDKSIRGNA